MEELKKEIENLLSNSKFNGDLLKLVSSLSRDRKMKVKIEDITSYLDRYHHKTKKVPIVPMSMRIYCILNDIFEGNIPKCRCGKVKAFDTIYKGFKLSCGNRSCYQSLPEVNKKRQQTTIDNFGSLKEAYDNTETMKEKYKTDNCSKLDWVKEKKVRTSRKNWGTDYPWQSEEGKQLQKEGTLRNWNVINISQHEDIKQKKIDTSMENWGTDNPSKNILIRKKILAQNGKEYITPSGNIFLIDGFENIALDYLYKKYDENIIVPQPDISIPYIDDENINHVWFPDVQINLDPVHLIEIKMFSFVSTEKYLYYQISSGISKGFCSYVILHHNDDLYKLVLTDVDKKYYKIYPLTRETVPENIKMRLMNYKFHIDYENYNGN